MSNPPNDAGVEKARSTSPQDRMTTEARGTGAGQQKTVANNTPARATSTSPKLTENSTQQVKQTVQQSNERRDKYLKAILDCHVTKKYQSDGVNTFCNYFARDVMKNMGLKISEHEGEAIYPDIKANCLWYWLRGWGKKRGWIKVDWKRAQAEADDGYPAIGVMLRAAHNSHVWVVRPKDNEKESLLKAVALTLGRNYLTPDDETTKNVLLNSNGNDRKALVKSGKAHKKKNPQKKIALPDGPAVAQAGTNNYEYGRPLRESIKNPTTQYWVYHPTDNGK
ncbi:MAG: hypothetical protein PHW04_09725 [Candidatus Wallbacteria bacterium]|nr:hypothetical protein [Candidatus Wallbacteria bacterium]